MALSLIPCTALAQQPEPGDTAAPAADRFTRHGGLRDRFVNRPRWDVGVALGVFILRTEVALLSARLNDLDVLESQEVRSSTDAPLPLIGLDVEFIPADRMMLRLGGQLFGISVKDTVDGSWGEARLEYEFYPWRNVGFGAGLTYVNLDIEASPKGAVVTDFRWRYRYVGPRLYVALAF